MPLVTQMDIFSDQYFVVLLDNYEWNFHQSGQVFLRFADLTIKCRYKGFGVTKNKASLLLEVDDPVYRKNEDVKRYFDEFEGEVFVER